MKKIKMIAKNSAGNVMRCPGGIVHINIPGVSLHLHELQFIAVARLMQDASSCLMEDALSVLLKEK